MNFVSKLVQGILDVAALLGCIAGGYLIFLAVFADSAPQQAALAAVGVGFGAIPYMLSAIGHRQLVRNALLRDGERY